MQQSPECHRGARDFIELWAVQGTRANEPFNLQVCRLISQWTLLSVSKVLLEKLSEEGLEIPQTHVSFLDVARDYMPYVIALEN